MSWDVSIFLDESPEKQISALLNALPSTVLVPKRPHITLAVYDGTPAADAVDVVARWAVSTPSVAIDFEMLGVTRKSPTSVLLLPKVTDGLLGIQRRLIEMLKTQGVEPPSHYRPEHWMPHCTLAKNVAAAEEQEVLELCRKADIFLRADCAKGAILDFEPFKEICSWKLHRPGQALK